MQNKYQKGFEISERFHQIVPAASHTYSKGEDQFPYVSPRIMSHADGAYCWDVDGNQFIDWAMGNRVFILGHNNKAVNNAVKEQIDKGLNFTRPGILEYELAEFLVEFLPVAEMVKFGKNGSDVTTAAVKLARAYTQRTHVAYCKQHPFYSVHDWFIGTTQMSEGVLETEKKYSLGFNYADIESVKKLFAENPDQIACLILEPVKNDKPCGTCTKNCHRGVCKEGASHFLTELRELCTQHGVVLIFDEMISGLRFDLKGAHHLYGVYPDLATFGKCISNGFSFSLLAGKEEIMKLGGMKYDGKRVFLLSQTHGSETCGLAAAMATLKECQKVDVNAHIWRIGGMLREGFEKIAQKHQVTNHVRMIGFDCNPQILCTHQDGTYYPELHTSFHEEMIENRVLIPWISITYAHTEKELEQTFEAFEKAMAKVANIVHNGLDVNDSFVGDAVKPVFRPFN